LCRPNTFGSRDIRSATQPLSLHSFVGSLLTTFFFSSHFQRAGGKGNKFKVVFVATLRFRPSFSSRTLYHNHITFDTSTMAADASAAEVYDKMQESERPLD
jgi:hypothetical protein